MEELSLNVVAILFGAGLLAGLVDSIAGGGGLISVPALLSVGMPPVEALATNKLQSSFGSFSATLNYARKGHVNPLHMKVGIAFTFTGATIGTYAVQALDSSLMLQIIPFLLLGAALYFAVGPKMHNEDAHHLMEKGPFYLLFGLGIGFYDGFFGPGTGSFWTVAFVAVLGFNVLKAIAHTKVVNFTSNIASFSFFALSGHVIWSYGLVMAAGQFIGARIGSSLAMTHGARLVKPLLIIVSVVMTAKLIYDHPDILLHQWAAQLLSLLGW